MDLFSAWDFPVHLVREDLDLAVLKHYNYIIGIDEVGRGSLAGPVMSAAVVLHRELLSLRELNDSKKMTLQQRENTFKRITGKTSAIGIGIAFPFEIDQWNIFQATKLSMYRAIENLPKHPYENAVLLVDGLKLLHPLYESFCLIKGDSKSPSIMAASIVAKVARDSLMLIYDELYPKFQFKKNKGYGTTFHRELIISGNYTQIHRKKFDPLKEILQGK